MALQAVRRREEQDKDFGDFNWQEHSEKEQRQLDEIKKLSTKQKDKAEYYDELDKKLAATSLEDHGTASSSTLDSESSSSLTSTSATDGATGSETEPPRPGSGLAYLNKSAGKFQKYTDKVEKKGNSNENWYVKFKLMSSLHTYENFLPGE